MGMHCKQARRLALAEIGSLGSGTPFTGSGRFSAAPAGDEGYELDTMDLMDAASSYDS